MKALRIALGTLQVLGFAWTYVLTEIVPKQTISLSGNPAALGMAAVFGTAFVSAIIAGILAAKLNRAAPLWVLGTAFIPWIVPLILCFLKPAPDQSYVPRRREDDAIAAAGTELAFNEQGYCSRCLAETTDESPGSVSTMNGVGTALQGTRWREKGLDPCPHCGSVVQQKWRMFGFGVKPLGTYRILYVKQGIFSTRYFGRRLKDDPVRKQGTPATVNAL